MANTIVLIPVNGYVNRLRALASAALLAEDLKADLRVAWIPDDAAPSRPEAIFGAEFLTRYGVRASDRLNERARKAAHEAPSGFTRLGAHEARLRGGYYGEQRFMGEVAEFFDGGAVNKQLVLVSGGLFTLQEGGTPEGDLQFTARRREFYARIQFSQAVQERAEAAIQGSPPYVGLHIRNSERRMLAPPRRRIFNALREVTRTVGTRHLFVAADSEKGAVGWRRTLSARGYNTLGQAARSVARAQDLSEGGVAALADWLALARASGVVYFEWSSFAREAIVSGGVEGTSMPLAGGVAGRTIQHAGVRLRRAAGTAKAGLKNRRQ